MEFMRNGGFFCGKGAKKEGGPLKKEGERIYGTFGRILRGYEFLFSRPYLRPPNVL